MFPNYHSNLSSLSDGRICFYRRHVPTESEIRMRIKRTLKAA